MHRPFVLKSQLPGVLAPALEGAVNAPNDLHLELLTEGLATEPKLEGISLQFSRFLAKYLPLQVHCQKGSHARYLAFSPFLF